MIIIGLLVLIAATVFGLDLIWKNDVTITDPVVFGQTLGIHSAAVLFLVGVITGAAVIVGIALLMAGLRRKGFKAMKHRQQRKLVKGTGVERDKLQAENAELRQELSHDGARDQLRDDVPVPPGPSVGDTPPQAEHVGARAVEPPVAPR